MNLKKTFTDRFPLASKIIEEAKTRKHPKSWTNKLKENIKWRGLTEEELLKILEESSKGFITPNYELDFYKKYNIVQDLNFVNIFPATCSLVKDPVFEIDRENIVGICPQAEPRHKDAMERARGFVLFTEGKPIGYLKCVGPSSFLAFENLADRDGKILLARGMLYALPYQISETLRNISLRNLEAGKWVGVDIEDIVKSGRKVSFTPMRLVQDEKVVDKLKELSHKFLKELPAVIHLAEADLTKLGRGDSIDAIERI